MCVTPSQPEVTHPPQWSPSMPGRTSVREATVLRGWPAFSSARDEAAVRQGPGLHQTPYLTAYMTIELNQFADTKHKQSQIHFVESLVLMDERKDLFHFSHCSKAFFRLQNYLSFWATLSIKRNQFKTIACVHFRHNYIRLWTFMYLRLGTKVHYQEVRLHASVPLW